VFVAAACSSAVGPELESLESARARWEREGFTSYTFVMQRFCFCGHDLHRPVRIDVLDGNVIAAAYVDDGEPLGIPLDEVDTIESLFDEVQAAIDREAHQILAEYDAGLGYPRSVSIDFILEAIDDEMAFSVLDVDALALPLRR
jgi:hypothetical protein